MTSRLLASAVLAVTLTACAAFQAAPTAQTCATSQNQLTAAEASLAIADVALTSAQQAGADSARIDRIEKDVAAIQNVVVALQLSVSKNCPAT